MRQGALLVVALLLCVVLAFLGGIQWEKTRQAKANVSVVQKDTKVVQKITAKTAEKRSQVDDKIKTVPVVDSDCNVTDDFMQLLRDTRADAIDRSD